MCFSITIGAQIIVGPGSGSGGGGGGSGTVTEVDTSAPLAGGPITTDGTISCATCGVTANPLSQFAATTSAQLAGVISDEIGSGQLVFNSSATLSQPTFTTFFDLETAGVRFSASDGILTLLGLGTGSDEDLSLNFDDVADTITFSSSTGVTTLAYTSLLQSITHNVTGTQQLITLNNSAAAGTSYIQFTPAATNANAGLRVNVGASNAIFVADTTQDRWEMSTGNGSQNWSWGSAGFISSTTIDLVSTGVRFTGADGVLTLLGLGNGNDENLTFDFDNAAANEVNIASGTGVTTIDFGTIILEGAFASSDGSAGVTVTSCTSFKDGLCVAGT